MNALARRIIHRICPVITVMLAVYLVSMTASAEPRWEILTSQEIVTCLTLDGPWLYTGTSMGLMRWETSTMTREYYPPSGNFFNPVNTVAVMPDGTVWCGMEDMAVIRFDSAGRRDFTYLDGIPAYNVFVVSKPSIETEKPAWIVYPPVVDMWVDSPDSVNFVFWGRGVSTYNGTSWKTIEMDRPLFPNTIIKGPDNRLYAAARTGVYRYNSGVWTRISLTDIECTSIMFGSENDILWVGTIDRGIYRLRIESSGWSDAEAHFTDLNGLAFGEVTFFYQDNDGSIWFGATNGLFHMTGDDIRMYSTADNLPHNQVNCLLRESDASLWAGTQHGLARFDGASWEAFHYADELVDDSVVTVLSDDDGSEWFVSKSGIARRENGIWKEHYVMADGIAGDYIMSAAFDHDGRLWVGAYKGLSVLDGASWKSYTPEDIPVLSKGARDIAIDSDNVLWVATIQGLLRIEGDDIRVFDNTNTPIESNNFNSIAIAPNGDIWLGTNNGVYCYDGAAWTRHTTLNRGWMDIVYYVRDVAVDSTGCVWAATDDGVSVFDGVHWKNIYEGPGLLPSSSTRAVAAAPDGAVWVSTTAGLAKYSGGEWTTFTTADGLSANSLISLSFAPDGTLFGGTSGKGVNILHPEPSVGIAASTAALPVPLTLATHPNPFNAATSIDFTLDRPGDVTLTIYNCAGQTVRRLIDRSMPAGPHAILWDSLDDRGGPVSSGVYIARVTAHGHAASGKMMVVR